jgi:hypothetical protein
MTVDGSGICKNLVDADRGTAGDSNEYGKVVVLW